jgi:hypothetical protein
MTKFALWLVYLFKGVIGWLGADYAQLHEILRIKLMMDFRRKPSIYANSGKNNQKFSFQLGMYAFMGIFLCMCFFTFKDAMMAYTLFFAVLMVMLTTTLMTEFTSVLFDERDNHILLMRPVSDRTLLLSRVLHIQFYVGYIALAIGLPATIVTLFMHNVLAAFLMLTAIGCCTWICIILTTIIYMGLSKVISSSRFKDIITYFQIAMAMIVMLSYQIIPRMMEIKGTQMFSMSIHSYTFAVPPAWLAAIVHLGIAEGMSTSILLLALIGFVFALAGGILMIRFMSHGFNNLLTTTTEASPDTVETNHQSEAITTSRQITGLKRLLCVSQLEQTGWKLAMAITKRDRKFKQAVYPSFGLMLIFAFIALRPDLNDLANSLKKLSETSQYFMLIFFGTFATMSLGQIVFTDIPEAGWIYRALPITQPGHLMSGALKAMIIRFFLPSYLLLFTPALFVWGFKIVPVVMIGCLLTVTLAIIQMYLQKPGLPFTQPREMVAKGSQFLIMMLIFVIMGAITGVVFLISLLPVWWTIPIALIIIVINAYAWRKMRQNYGLEVLTIAERRRSKG